MTASDSEVSASLKKTLDIHGYGFHYSVLRRVDDLVKSQDTSWRLFGAEFPIINKGVPTHIDFVLQHKELNTYITAECKRADPAKANWCFVKTPYTWRDNKEEFVQFDKFTLKNNHFNLRTALAHTDTPVADLGIEVKTGEKGDGVTPSEKSAINGAVSQILKGTSGFLNYFEDNLVSGLSDSLSPFRFIPVIFTTAQLWVTETDLGGADLQTGELPKDSVNAKKVQWLGLITIVRFPYHQTQN